RGRLPNRDPCPGCGVCLRPRADFRAIRSRVGGGHTLGAGRRLCWPDRFAGWAFVDRRRLVHRSVAPVVLAVPAALVVVLAVPAAVLGVLGVPAVPVALADHSGDRFGFGLLADRFAVLAVLVALAAPVDPGWPDYHFAAGCRAGRGRPIACAS